MTIHGYAADVVVDAETVWDDMTKIDPDNEGTAVDLFSGVSRSVFMFIDEKPGYFSPHEGCETVYCDHYAALRRARNDKDIVDADGNDLFDVLVSP